MMEKKQLRAIFLYESKLGHKVAEATRNINSAFGQGTANERMRKRWFQKFRNGDESLEDEEGRGRSSAVDNDELKVLVEADPRTKIRELAIKSPNSSGPTQATLKIKKARQIDAA
ncbi:histone-lysine N-methyltransferase SETMAR-like [Odontomachus brunneus]|uniref:histone-lysine N-methyltransferase SETMAR-like n=1 Tax=Odontomachus brunneus TaxID=486640 RepID=UPI0013F23E1F|nr:histone-lysine N-methyltransferase SETMAR-like [Odontomachus brunneus]